MLDICHLHPGFYDFEYCLQLRVFPWSVSLLSVIMLHVLHLTCLCCGSLMHLINVSWGEASCSHGNWGEKRQWIMENRVGKHLWDHLIDSFPHGEVYKCIAPSSHLRKEFWCYQCIRITSCMMSWNHSLKTTGIFTIKALVIFCSIATFWYDTEISGVTTFAKRILSLLSKRGCRDIKMM